ncbi:hypothetical protein [Escherichia coli]|uniref:hypothetical protein n=2 Tax=Escherichia coli TaxID=562 RepID=UPI00100AB368|nr:hypothetical protein [Escherichia coli]
MSTEMTGGISHADFQQTGRNALFLAPLMPSPFPAPLFFRDRRAARGMNLPPAASVSRPVWYGTGGFSAQARRR